MLKDREPRAHWCPISLCTASSRTAQLSVVGRAASSLDVQSPQGKTDTMTSMSHSLGRKPGSAPWSARGQHSPSRTRRPSRALLLPEAQSSWAASTVGGGGGGGGCRRGAPRGSWWDLHRPTTCISMSSAAKLPAQRLISMSVLPDSTEITPGQGSVRSLNITANSLCPQEMTVFCFVCRIIQRQFSHCLKSTLFAVLGFTSY